VRSLTVIFDVVSAATPFTSERITRYYPDAPETIFDIIHDYLKLYIKNSGNIGYVDIAIKTDRGSYPKKTMEQLRYIIMKIIGDADGNIPLTQLQQSLMFDQLYSYRPKK